MTCSVGDKAQTSIKEWLAGQRAIIRERKRQAKLAEKAW